VVETTNTRNETRLEILLLLLMGVVILLMVAIVGLFWRMNQLQGEVLATLVFLQMQTEPVSLETETAAPAFSLPDTEGNVISLADMAGQRALLAFSSVTCAACRQTWPELTRFSETHADVQVVMFSHGTLEESRQMKQEQDFSFPVLVAQPEVLQAYQVPGTPFFYVIDARGIIAGSGFANTAQELERLACADGACQP
jgi:methylamine dehydrogenase accessory protein MauD